MAYTPLRFAVYDRTGRPQADLTGILSAQHVWSTDGTDTLEFTLIGDPGIEKGWRIVYTDSMNRLREYIVTSPQTKRAAGLPMTSLACQGSMCELSQGFIVEQRNRGLTAVQALTKALTGTRWTVGTVDGTQTADTSFYHVSPLEAIQTICDTYSLEAVASYTANTENTGVGSRTISLRARQGRSAGTLRRFEYHRDLSEITRTCDSSNVVTRLYGYGKGLEQTDDDGNATGGYSRKISFADINNGKAYVEDANATKIWGIPDAQGVMQPSCGIFEDGDCEDPKSLLAETKKELEKRRTPTVTYEANVLAFEQAGLGLDGVDLGDSVQIVDDSFTPRLALEGRVLKIEENLLDPADTTITLGNLIRTATSALSAMKQQLDSLGSSTGAWNDAAGLRPNYLDSIINGLNAQLNATGGYTYITPGQGILVYDRPQDQNPTMCIQIGGGYFRIADSKNSDGTWNFRTAGSGHGLYADVLFTGKITDGQSYWDLTNHEMSMIGAFETRSDDGHSVARFVPDYDWRDSRQNRADGSGIVFSDTGRTTSTGSKIPDRLAWISFVGWNKTTGKPLNAIYAGVDTYDGKAAGLTLGTGSLAADEAHTVAGLHVTNSDGSFGFELDASTSTAYLGGLLGNWTGLGTFYMAYWQDCKTGAFNSSVYKVAVGTPARKGRYKPLATLDHRGGANASQFFDTTVSDASASGWSVYVNSAPSTLVTRLPDITWESENSTGQIRNLKVSGGYTATTFSGTQSFYLNTLGVLLT